MLAEFISSKKKGNEERSSNWIATLKPQHTVKNKKQKKTLMERLLQALNTEGKEILFMYDKKKHENLEVNRKGLFLTT